MSAEGDRLRHVHSASDPTASNHGNARDCSHFLDRDRRRNAPIGEQLADLDIIGATSLYASPARPTQPGRVDDSDPLLHQSPRRVTGDPAADLLGDHRNVEPPGDFSQFRQQATEIRVAFGLDRLLEHI
jgi:hypothetical protein